MPRKTRRPVLLPASAPHPVRSRWPGYLLTAVLAAALGSGATYLAVRPRLTAPPSASPLAPPLLGAGGASPPASLTSGQPPAQAALTLANWYEDRQQWPQSIAAYQQALAGGLDNPDIRTDYGVALFQSGQPQKALAQYQMAQRMNPAHENSLFNQGSAYLLLHDTAHARAAWQDYLRRFPAGQHVADARQFLQQTPAR